MDTSHEQKHQRSQRKVDIREQEPEISKKKCEVEVTGKDRTVMLREISIFLTRLKQYYGVTPLIYTDHERYREYIQGNFAEYPLTIRDAITPIQWSFIHKWTFWQYGDHGHVPGITGFVDLDAFYGQRDQLTTFVNYS